LTRVLVTIPGGQSMLDDEFSRLSRREEQDVRTARSAFNPKRMAAIIDAGRTGPCGGRDDPTRSISADGGEPSDDWSCRLTVSHYDPGSDHQCAREATLTRALGLVNQPRCTTPVSSILLPAGIAQAALTADTCHKPTGYRTRSRRNVRHHGTASGVCLCGAPGDQLDRPATIAGSRRRSDAGLSGGRRP
jgi:hypothetical protein